MTSLTYLVAPGGRLAGTVRVPGDKSISHRAVMFAALAEGATEIRGFLDGEDCLRTMHAFAAMGVEIERYSATHLCVHGVGLRGLQAPAEVLDLGNSGTSMRLMTGLLSGQKFASVLTGDASLSKRPMRRIVDPLRQMGAQITTSETGTAPLHIQPAAALQGLIYRSPVSSAQVKSGILLAGLYAQGRTEVFEPEPSRDHTERMLQAFGVKVEAEPGRAALQGGQTLHAAAIEVPADISSAAFFLVGAAIVPHAELHLNAVGINPTRTGVIDILRRMGVEIVLENQRDCGGEPVADLRVRAPGRLRGIDIDHALVALAIDEMPAIFVAAACAEGLTRVSDAAELRVKESDRIAAMCEGLQILGVQTEPQPDGAIIHGLGAAALGGGRIDSHGDHRIAMAFAMAALRAAAPIHILDCENVNTSFPGFVELAHRAGLRISVDAAA